MSRDNIVRDKSYAFAIRIVNAYKFLTNDQKEYVLSKQMLRSGTAIGALVAEAHHAQSSADFLNKMNVAFSRAKSKLIIVGSLSKIGKLDLPNYPHIDKMLNSKHSKII